MSKFLEWVWQLIPWLKTTRPQTPRYQLIEIDKSILESREDAAAIVTLKNHPGMVALLNRFKIQQAYIEKQLKTRQKDLRDVDILQLSYSWLGYVESEINRAIRETSQKKISTVVPEDQVNLEFERIKTAIEAVGITNP